MEVKVLKVNDGEGQVLLTYKRLAADRGNKRIEEAYENREVLHLRLLLKDKLLSVADISPSLRIIFADHEPDLLTGIFVQIFLIRIGYKARRNKNPYGAFIDLGGCDGLLHISEMSWGRVENPKKVFKVGDVVKVLADLLVRLIKINNFRSHFLAALKYIGGLVNMFFGYL